MARLNKDDSVRIGIDFGGTKIEGLVLRGPRNNPIELVRRRIPTEGDKGYEHVLEQVLSLIHGLVQEYGNSSTPVPIGMGMPGSVTKQGLIKNSNTLCLNGTPFRDELIERLGQPIVFANDANCFALAEAILGKGNGHNLVYGIILGTGVGGGLVFNGALHEGPQSIAGEWGHMILDPSTNRECHCGQKGCVETFLAGPSVEKHYIELGGDTVRLPQIVERRTNGDSIARECIRSWLDYYGRAIASLINVLDPDIIILGGGVSLVDCLYDEGMEYVSRYVFTDELLTPIVRHSLGDSAGALGATLLAY